MPETTQVLQLRISPGLYADLASEVERRKERGERTSLNKVAVEWLQSGKDLYRKRTRPRQGER